jgi:hypothetical protein
MLTPRISTRRGHPVKQHGHGRDTGTDETMEELAAYAALTTAIAGVGYAVAFVIVKSAIWSAVFLLGGAVLSLIVLVTVYQRFRGIHATLAQLALILAALGAAGAAIHGGYDLANELHPDNALTGFPNPVDPRGLLTFGASGIALIVASELVRRDPSLPAWARWLALVAGVSLVATWLGRLIILDASSPLVLGPALVAGVLNPIVYIALGIWLMRDGADGA